MAAQAAVEVRGVAFPPAGTWKIDPVHTTVEFVARHMLTKSRGRFTGFEGTVEVAERPEDARVDVSIDTSTIQTNQGMRDDHLKGEDFLDVEKFPVMTFRSTSLHPTGETTFELVGDLTIKDVTREVVLDSEFLGWGPGPQGGSVMTFSAKTEIEREDWDMTWNMAVETGGFLVGKKVQIELEVEANLV
jgi:polyisoprenoid-binding protein YceI